MTVKPLLIATAVALCVCSFLDGWSTVQFLTLTHNKEGNPLFGPYPSTFQVWGEGTAIIALELAFGWWAASKRRWAGWLVAAGFLIQACWQLRNYFDNAASYEHIHHVFK